MKKILFICIIITSATFAFADDGLYVGVGAGYGNINTSTINGNNFANGSNSQSGGNAVGAVYVGYDFSHYVGVQADFDYIANVQHSTGYNSVTGSNSSFSASQQIIDLGVTGHLPFSLFANALSGISVFGKLALGYSTTTFGGGTLLSQNTPSGSVNIPSSASTWVPVIAGGAEYGIGSVGIRLEYEYIGNTNVSINNLNSMNVNNSLVLLSALYHF